MVKTHELLSCNYWFPGMLSYIKSYINTCDVCSRGKAPRHAKHGELTPLPVPSGPWKSVSCDLITDLPPSGPEQFDTVLVFVDRFTKMAHFIPCHKSTDAPEFANMYLTHIIRLHGISESIVSDRGSIFTSHFWTSLSSLMGLKRKLSTAFHPQTDGQTERMNQTLEQYLRIYCNYQQDDWSNLLALTEFSYNNSLQASTGFSPFYTNYGYNPTFTLNLRTPVSTPSAKAYAESLRSIHDQLIDNLKSAQDHQARYYDAKHKPMSFNVGDKVWLLSTNIRTERPSKKLDWKRLGPFPITKRIGTQAYKLQLPKSMRIHPVFHVSLLEPYKTSSIPNRTRPPPPPITIDSQQEFEVDQILNSKYEGKQLKYLIKWKGCPISDNSWEPDHFLKNCRELVKAFHDRYPSKPRP
jgi:chemotaxis protein CheY-P-specific phosphatase CheC